MFEMKLDTKAIEKALIKHLTDVMGISTDGKETVVSLTVGRKTTTKPKPDVTATISIYEAGELTTSTTAIDLAVENTKPTQEALPDTQPNADHPFVDVTEDEPVEAEVAEETVVPNDAFGSESDQPKETPEAPSGGLFN